MASFFYLLEEEDNHTATLARMLPSWGRPLTGLPAEMIEVIQSDAAPAGHRTLALWNPPQLAPSSLTEWNTKLPPVRRWPPTPAAL